jgi:hypothetical protein
MVASSKGRIVRGKTFGDISVGDTSPERKLYTYCASIFWSFFLICCTANLHPTYCCTEGGRILGRNPGKILNSFLAVSHLYSFALRFLFLQTHATSYSFYNSLCTLYRRNEQNLIENHTPFHMVYEIHSETLSLRTLKIKPETSKKLYGHTFMNSASVENLQKELDLPIYDRPLR